MRERRVSPRQAIIGINVPPGGWAAAFALPLLLDVLGTLVAVDGVTLALCLPDTPTAAAESERIPAGIEVLSGVTVAATSLPAVADAFAERRFERIAFVATDAVGLSARLLSTVLSALATEPSIVGRTPEGGTYLVGLRAEWVRSDPDAAGALLALLEQTGVWRRLPGRQVEPLPRLGELGSLAELRSAMRGRERFLPRLAGQLKEHG